jgi:prepilin signal peptidase PulO-like enzyme (type II secretory pathway)
VDGVAVLVAAVAGAAGGYLSGLAADRLAAGRYAEGTDGYDPDDAALAPLTPPTTLRQRLVLTALGAAAVGTLATQFRFGDIVAYFAVLLIAYMAAMVVDLQYLRLPNVVTYPMAVVAVAGSYLLSARHDVPVVGTWAGAVGYAGFLFMIRISYRLLRGREGMGLGDVKLALSLGASAGWLGGVLVYEPDPQVLLSTPPAIGAILAIIYCSLAGTLLGAIGGVVVVRRFDREFPFGPALVFGWLLVVILADRLVV